MSTAKPTGKAKGERPGEEPAEDSRVVHLTSEDFDEAANGASVPMLVDFWAPWCGPCRMMAPVLEDLAEEYDGRAIIAKVNTDENQDLAIRFGIRGIPSLLIMKDGEEVERIVGVSPAAKLKERIDSVIG